MIVTDKGGQPVRDVVVLVEAASKAVVVAAPARVVITQEGARFAPFLTVVPVGSTLRFVNRDSFDHHVRAMPGGPPGSVPAAKNFEQRLDGIEGAVIVDEYEPRTAPRKRSGVSAAEVQVDSAPDGAAEINLWRPDQLQEQSSQRLQVGNAPVKATAQLNFTPRRERA